MANKIQWGLKKIEIGDATTDNTDPVSLKTVPWTKVNSAVYANTEGTRTPIPIEESNIPLTSLVGAGGEWTLTWTTYSNDGELLAELEGGTYIPAAGGEGEQYAPPSEAKSISKFVKFTNLQDGGVKFYNALISTVRTGNFNKEGLPELQITATAQAVAEGFHPVVEFKAP